MIWLKLVSVKLWLSLAASLALLVALWGAYHSVKSIGYREAKAEQLVIDKARDEATMAQVLKGVKDTAKLQTKANQIQEQTNAKLAANSNRIAIVVDGLSNRADRPSPSSLPSGTNSGESVAGCNGAGLYRPDAEFLARESSRTAELQGRLKACYEAVDELGAVLNVPG